MLFNPVLDISRLDVSPYLIGDSTKLKLSVFTEEFQAKSH
jgi:hypothetical protein